MTPLSASWTPIDPEVPIYHCTPPGGVGSASVSVTNPGDQTGTVGTPVNLHVRASDTDGGRLSYSASDLPAGLSIEQWPDRRHADHSGQLTGHDHRYRRDRTIGHDHV